MTKEEALKTMMLLSALESWAFSTKNLQAVLNKPRTHADQQAADTAARDWLTSIGSEPT